ncbi:MULTISPECIES: ABC transporter permease [unclassified Sphingomonas]|uniref:ABC transporter permease n=1 Tax=unclassified Sphingomonas TaxID=196159 RepID=UPI00082C8B8F|nr:MULTISPECIES: ABC transporter permease [unclassified Sphingomonas]
MANTLSPGAASAHSIDPALDEIEEIKPLDEKENFWPIRLVAIVSFLGLWEVLGSYVVDPLMLSAPSKITEALFDLLVSGELLDALYQSATTLIYGFVLATVIGILLGMFIGRYRKVEAATDWLVNGLYATPLVALVPLVTLWFGLGFSAKLFIVCIISVFPILINTASGVRNVGASLLDVGNAFAADERQTFVKIILPASIPYIMTGIRLGIGRAIIGMIVAEFYTSVGGLGALIMKFGNQYDTAAMFVPILTLALMGVLLTTIVRKAEAAFEPWKAS